MSSTPSDLIPPFADDAGFMPLDQAIDEACTTLDLPLLGGPSGRGWSMISTAQRCPRLFQATYDVRGADGKEKETPAPALQIGGLYHALQALYYGYGIADGAVCYRDRGLIRPDLLPPRERKRTQRQIPPDGADKLLAALRCAAGTFADQSLLLVEEAARCFDAHADYYGRGNEDVFPLAFADQFLAATSTPPAGAPGPSLLLVEEAARCFDAHADYYGRGNEDVFPLAVEWPAEHPGLGYTCRYDMIAELGPSDPLADLAAFGPARVEGRRPVVIFERKTAKWLSEYATESWPMDGEVLGQILCWKPSGCEKLFGPLAAVVVDVVTKDRSPKCARIVVPPDSTLVSAHKRWVMATQAEILGWRATRVYPQRFGACWQWGQRCGMWHECAGRAAGEGSDPASEV